jgi:hypothetical protein
MDTVAPLRGFPVRFPGQWAPLLALMTAHANGDPDATGRLCRIAQAPPDAGIGRALQDFLKFSQQDAVYVVRELARP